jgi:hypothetical protein
MYFVQGNYEVNVNQIVTGKKIYPGYMKGSEGV